MNESARSRLAISLSQVTSRMNVEQWQNGRNASLGGAGISLAVALVAAQVAASTRVDVSFALICAFLAIPFWLGVWQLCSNVVLWGEVGRKHAQNIGWFSSGVAIVIVAVLLLALSLASLLYTFCGAFWVTAFFSVCTAMFVIGSYHSYCVQKLAMQGTSDSGHAVKPE